MFVEAVLAHSRRRPPSPSPPAAQIFPAANAEVLRSISETSAVVYGCGSLYTSICPSLILAGMGEHVAALRRPKVLFLNGTIDRETVRGPAPRLGWAWTCMGGLQRMKPWRAH